MALALHRLDLPDADDPRVFLAYQGTAERADGVLHVPPRGRLDLGTWLNAAPVAWWRQVLAVDEVIVEIDGHGRIELWGADGATARRRDVHEVDGRLRLTLSTADATWFWIEVDGAQDGARISQVTWSVPGDGEPRRASVVVPTFARESDALAQAGRFLAMTDVVARVFVVDQAGTLTADTAFAELRRSAGQRLVLMTQDNLGGSGGYARGMLASLDHPNDPVYLSDDDALTTPESLRRLLALQHAAAAPVILGTSLLEADDPGRLTAVAEAVDRATFFWGPADGLTRPIDVAVTNPAGWAVLRPSARADYTGWWGTLLPAGAVARLGLPAPYFLKWDDAEYGLRGQRHGIASYTVPGSSVWHPTWAAKQTASGWSSLPLHRNRIATAAAYRASPRVLLDSFTHQVKHVLSLQYPTAALWNAALAQVLDGPSWVGHDLRELRPRAQRVVDAVSERTPAGLQRAARSEHPLSGAELAHQTARGFLGLCRPVRRHRTDVREVAADELHWSRTIGADAVVLTDTAGHSDRSLLRRPATARRLLGDALRLHLAALLRWPRLAADYGHALARTTTPEAWWGVIDATGHGVDN